MTKKLKSDPKKNGIPAFLQVQNRVPLSGKLRQRLAEVQQSTFSTERVDWRKPKGMSWVEFDAWQEGENASRRVKREERFAVLKDKKAHQPKVPSLRDGLLGVSHFAAKLDLPPRIVRQGLRKCFTKPKFGWAFTASDEAKVIKALQTWRK